MTQTAMKILSAGSTIVRRNLGIFKIIGGGKMIVVHVRKVLIITIKTCNYYVVQHVS